MSKKTRFTYEAIFSWDEELNHYVITFPDVPAAQAVADSFQSGCVMATDALEEVLAEYIVDSKEVPVAHMNHPIQAHQERVIISSCLDSGDIEKKYYMSIEEAAEALGVTRVRVYALIKNERLKAKCFDRPMMVQVASVNEFKASGRRPGRPRKTN